MPGHRRVRRFLLAVAAVIGIAAIGVVVRGAVSGGAAADRGGTSGLAALPVKPTAAGGFSVDKARSSTLGRGESAIATARGRSVRVARHRGGRTRTVRARVFNGHRIPLTFLVRKRSGAWLDVSLPTRPNLSRGWVRARDVRVTTTGFALVVRLRSHRVELRSNGRTVMKTRVGVGRSLSPTPTGRYFVTDIVRPKDPGGFFGPYALGLSAHSTVYTSFEGGDGQVGIHGTNAPGAIGTDVSHGCIRVRNDVITRLAKRVPLGTPVRIER